MNILLDTHYVLWSLFDPKKLRQQERGYFLNTDNTILVSVISLWEISLKYQLGKLTLKGIRPENLPLAITQSGFTIVGMTEVEASGFYQLPKMLHHDPFDRMLVWQAIQNRWWFLSKDKPIKAYKNKGLRLLDI